MEYEGSRGTLKKQFWTLCIQKTIQMAMNGMWDFEKTIMDSMDLEYKQMDCEQAILDLRDLEDNIDGFRVEYEWNVRFLRDYFRFYGLKIEHL